MSNEITTTSVGPTCGQAIELVEGRALRELFASTDP